MPFHQKRAHPVPDLHAVIEEYEDSGSGARHIHVRTDDPEMAFLVAFPTIPQSSDGRAHILEHMTLCGSARYPVRDPFFAMVKRSMATFMNAFTYPDRTVYPFASQDKTDFFNLLGVYLDAAFFPTLDYCDFQQEGWRLVWAQDKLSLQGVVFNEMKDAFADPLRALDHGISQQIFHGTTYAMESGGDPLDIPNLTYADLKAFHATHYHPSQAVFMTSGRVDVAAVQGMIEEQVLARLPGRFPRMRPDLAMPWAAPRTAHIVTPAQEGKENEYGFQFSWLLGEAVDPPSFFRASLLEAGLLGDSSSPLMRAMESAGFGYPSSFNHLESGARQMVLHVGMEGLKKNAVAKARKHLWSALEQASEAGVPTAMLKAALRNIRFDQREINGGDVPYGLHLLLSALPAAMMDADIIDAFDVEPFLRQLDADIQDPQFFKDMVKALIESPARLESTVYADAGFSARRTALEEQRLAQLAAGLSAAERERIVQESADLLAQQRKMVDKDVLPRIVPSAVAPEAKPDFPVPPEDENVVVLEVATNGISYASILYDVSDFSAQDWPWLNLYAGLVPQLGVAGMGYEAGSAWRQQMVPDFSIDVAASQPLDADKPLQVFVEFSAKGLQGEQHQLATVLLQSIAAPRFDELERMAFLIDSHVQDVHGELAVKGESYASLGAAAALSPHEHFKNVMEGAAGLPFYRRLRQQVASESGTREIAEKLAALHAKITASRAYVIVAAEAPAASALAELLKPAIHDSGRTPRPLAKPETVVMEPLANTVLHAAAQVNHCYAAWPAPKLGHPGAAACAVLAEWLTNEVLHRAIREEGGAYGAGASYDAVAGILRMISTRDPRLLGTYVDFDAAIERALEAEMSQESIEEAIICVVRELDKPLPPYRQAMQAWSRRRVGITDQMRNQFRAGVLQCTASDLRAAAKTWLHRQTPSRCAFAGDDATECGDMRILHLAQLLE